MSIPMKLPLSEREVDAVSTMVAARLAMPLAAVVQRLGREAVERYVNLVKAHEHLLLAAGQRSYEDLCKTAGELVGGTAPPGWTARLGTRQVNAVVAMVAARRDMPLAEWEEANDDAERQARAHVAEELREDGDRVELCDEAEFLGWAVRRLARRMDASNGPLRHHPEIGAVRVLVGEADGLGRVSAKRRELRIWLSIISRFQRVAVGRGSSTSGDGHRTRSSWYS